MMRPCRMGRSEVSVTRSAAEVMVEVDAALQQLVDATRELVWDWDRRFDTAVGRVSAPDHVAVLALLDECFAHRWDHETVGQAPDVARDIAAGWGGLRAGQRLYACDTAESPLLFAAWWPWDSGTTFSVRIGARIANDAEAHQDLAKRLRSLFGA
jgi:hypothetical protein